jgi:AraC-like DNA-binding protein
MGAGRTATVTPRDTFGHRGVSVRLVLPLLAHLRSTGVDLRELLRRVGVAPSAIGSGDAFLEQDVVMRLLEHAEAAIGPDACFRAVGTVDFGLLEWVAGEFVVMQLLATSDTVNEGITHLVEGYALSHDVFGLTRDGESRIGVELPRTRPAASFLELTLGLIARAIATLSVPTVRPELHLAHARRRGVAEQPIPGVRIRFDQRVDAIELPDGALHATFRTANAANATRVRSTARELLARDAPSLIDRVRAHIVRALDDSDASAIGVARAMGISVRHLSRLLASEGSSHRELLDRARAELSARYQSEGLSSADVAMRLGYSDPSALRRAQRRWHSRTPRSPAPPTGNPHVVTKSERRRRT